jgi:DNA polymerase I-like protein with 3'-5' exonuclease and polymerase domains
MIHADALLETDPLCKNAKLLLQVHDELGKDLRSEIV